MIGKSWNYQFNDKPRSCGICCKTYKPLSPNSRYCGDKCKAVAKERCRARSKKRVAAMIIISLICSSAFAATIKHNPYSNKYELVDNDATIQYNQMNGKYVYASPDSALQHNPYSNKYELRKPNKSTGYNRQK